MATPHNKRSALGLSATIGAAALAAAGAYYLYGSKNAQKNRAQVKTWALRARNEVMRELEKVRELDLEQYKALITPIIKRYARLGEATQSEIRKLIGDFIAGWATSRGAPEITIQTVKAKRRRKRTSAKPRSKKSEQQPPEAES